MGAGLMGVEKRVKGEGKGCLHQGLLKSSADCDLLLPAASQEKDRSTSVSCLSSTHPALSAWSPCTCHPKPPHTCFPCGRISRESQGPDSHLEWKLPESLFLSLPYCTGMDGSPPPSVRPTWLQKTQGLGLLTAGKASVRLWGVVSG